MEVWTILVFVADGFIVLVVPLFELKDEVGLMVSFVPFINGEVERYV